MPALPKEYRDFSNSITEILRRKPKKGYFESMVESGQIDPLDAIEEVSSAIGNGNKTLAIQLLQDALADENKKQQLAYIDDLENKLNSLIEELQNMPEIDASQPISSNRSANLLIAGLGVVLMGIVTVVLIFVL